MRIRKPLYLISLRSLQLKRPRIPPTTQPKYTHKTSISSSVKLHCFIIPYNCHSQRQNTYMCIYKHPNSKKKKYPSQEKSAIVKSQMNLEASDNGNGNGGGGEEFPATGMGMRREKQPSRLLFSNTKGFFQSELLMSPIILGPIK